MLTTPEAFWNTVHRHLHSIYTIQPIVKLVVQPVGQPVGCLYTRYSLLFIRLSNRFDNRLYRVNGVLARQNVGGSSKMDHGSKYQDRTGSYGAQSLPLICCYCSRAVLTEPSRRSVLSLHSQCTQPLAAWITRGAAYGLRSA